MPEHAPGICQLAVPRADADALRLADARTYGRTYEELLTLGSYLTLGNARRGVAEFTPRMHQNFRRERAS